MKPVYVVLNIEFCRLGIQKCNLALRLPYFSNNRTEIVYAKQ